MRRRAFVGLIPAAAIALGKPAPVYSLAWHPDGGTLALGGFRDVRLVGRNQEARATLDGHAEAVRGVAFSPDGKWLAAAGGQPGRKGELKLWDAAARSAVWTASGHADCMYAVAFSPDGSTIATSSYDKLIKLWDAASGKETRTLKDHIDAVYGVAFTPDGKRLVSASADRSVKVWNAETGERLYTLSDATDGLNTVAVDPDGKRVAAGGLDKTLRIWSLGARGGDLLQTLIAHEDAVLQIAWSKDGRLASSSADRSIKFFRPEGLEEIGQPLRAKEWPMALRFSPDGRTLAAGYFDGSLKLIAEG